MKSRIHCSFEMFFFCSLLTFGVVMMCMRVISDVCAFPPSGHDMKS